MADKTIAYKTSFQEALKKLRKALDKIEATGITYELSQNMHNPNAWVTFTYKGQRYKFDYSQMKANYYHLRIPDPKDVFVLLVYAVEDLIRVADRGVFDFGRVIANFKALEFIEIPEWAIFMGFNTRPRNMLEVREKYNFLVKNSMNPNTNKEDFQKLQQAMEIAKQYFGS